MVKNILCMTRGFLSVLGFVLRPGVWPILLNISYVLEMIIASTVVELNALQRSTGTIGLTFLFSASQGSLPFNA